MEAAETEPDEQIHLNTTVGTVGNCFGISACQHVSVSACQHFISLGLRRPVAVIALPPNGRDFRGSAVLQPATSKASLRQLTENRRQPRAPPQWEMTSML